MGYIVAWCVTCRILLFDPRRIDDVDLHHVDWPDFWAQCPVCKDIKVFTCNEDLSD